MIPISLLAQIICINECREQLAREQLEGWKPSEVKAKVGGLGGRRKYDLPVGVRKRKTKGGDRYSALINPPRGKTKMVGTFDTPEEAHRAYCKAHIEYYGKQSRYWDQRHDICSA